MADLQASQLQGHVVGENPPQSSFPLSWAGAALKEVTRDLDGGGEKGAGGQRAELGPTHPRPTHSSAQGPDAASARPLHSRSLVRRPALPVIEAWSPSGRVQILTLTDDDMYKEPWAVMARHTEHLCSEIRRSSQNPPPFLLSFLPPSPMQRGSGCAWE